MDLNEKYTSLTGDTEDGDTYFNRGASTVTGNTPWYCSSKDDVWLLNLQNHPES